MVMNEENVLVSVVEAVAVVVVSQQVPVDSPQMC